MSTAILPGRSSVSSQAPPSKHGQKSLRSAAAGQRPAGVCRLVRTLATHKQVAGTACEDGIRRNAATTRRSLLALQTALLAASGPALAAPTQPAESNCESCSNSNSSLQEGDKAFVTTSSGLRILELREGTGAKPAAGQTCVVDWVGYTAGYQAKRIESTRETDTPFVFKLGQGEAIAAFEEAVSGMKQGGLRRIEIPGELVESLGYSRDKAIRYAAGPVPTTFAGRRALDFVLDNETLRDFNRTLLFDIRLSNVRG